MSMLLPRFFLLLHVAILCHCKSEAVLLSPWSTSLSLLQHLSCSTKMSIARVQNNGSRGYLDSLISIRGGESNGTIIITTTTAATIVVEDAAVQTQSINRNEGEEVILTKEKKLKKKNNRKKKKKEKEESFDLTLPATEMNSKEQNAEEKDTKCTQKKKRVINQKDTQSTKLPTGKKRKRRDASPLPSSNKVGGGKNGECIRRIKHEWRDIVKLGIGYDWITQQTITTRGRSTTGQREMNDNDHFYNYNYVRLGPFHNNLLHWHFSIRGPSNSDYDRGIYHGRIILPKDYPGSPPRVQVLTPSGRFVTGEDICLSASSFHPETWTPRWTILSLVEALRMHMLTTANEIGGLHASSENRRKFAEKSRIWKAGRLSHGRMVEEGLFISAAEQSEKLNASDVNVNDNQMIDLIRNVIDASSGDEDMHVNDNIGTDKVKNNKYNKPKSRADSEKRVKAKMKTKNSAKEVKKSGNAQTSTPRRIVEPSRRPHMSKVIIAIIGGIVHFFQKHLEFGIVFIGIILLFK
eukprot:CAMPEP_0203666930 /NCGR_PEP_ID=MMETSP0090-20130426/3853_1 /ASSEMBLY_ACC=CAM_ASM_001088 /TAXON_ID=426623 /ORGANISM="Chaetoceros affinis, Strain CCMP159" /LENGTH=520 /DNA_ID=CAMNT_0050530931 /DNA_START=88 /DNA_END=1650 /DNA_ORIENTATION=-